MPSINCNFKIIYHMKLIILLSFLPFCLVAQSKYFVNGVPLDSVKAEYVQIVGTSKLFSTKLTIDIDFGQNDNLWKSSDTKLVDDKGKTVSLNSMIDALNFMVSNGYEYVNSYAITVSNQNIYHYLCRKIKH